MLLLRTLHQRLLQLCLLVQLSSLAVTQPPRNDADYEYNTEANNKPQPSPITPGIQPSTVYTIHALPPDPPPAPDGGGARVSTTTATTPPLYSDHPPRGGSHPNDPIHFQNTEDANYESGDYDPSYDYSYDDYYPGEGASSATTSLERNLLSAPVKTVEEGALLRLKCKLAGLRNNESVTVSWYLNDTEITELSAHRRLKFLPYKTPPRLRITRIRMSDAGLYSGLWMSTSESQRGWCNQTVRVVPPAPRHPSPLPLQARNKVQDDSDYGDEVHSLAPVFSKHLQSILVKPAGNVAELKCPAKGENIVTRWEKDGQTPKRKIGEIRMRKNMLKMENLVPLDSGNYTCIVSNEHGSINHTFNVDVIERLASRPILKQNLQNQTVVLGTNATLECSVISDQPPFISWLKHPTQDSALDHAGKINQIYVIKEGGHRVTTEDPQVLVLSNVSDTDEGWYTCLAANSIGTSYSTAYLTVATEEELNPNDSPDSVLASPPGVPSYVLFIAVSVLLLVLLSACAASCCAVNKWKQEKRRSLELERERTNNTFSQHIKKVIVERHENEHSEEPLLVPSIKIERRPYRRCLGSNESHTMSEYELPLDSAWELSRDRLVLSNTLGEGAFGKVLKAELCSPDKKVTNTVAVKMLKEGHTDAELMDLVSEMEMMKIIGTHQNIINLIGCCTQEGPLFVVVEFAHHGNLRDFLRSSQPSALGYECAIDQDPKSALTQRDLLGFAYQVARGMDYLAAKKCVHRDLAARNVLVCQERILKIADFGLARDIHSQDYYRKTSEGRLPIKWMAPEALFSRMYTTASDVWAFGILLWEIMSLGGTPYPSVPSVQNLFNLLREGHRMLKPHHCSMETYVLMKECWRYNAGDRPTFRDILNELSRQLSMVTNEEYLDLTVSAHLDTPPSSYDSGVTSVMLPQQI